MLKHVLGFDHILIVEIEMNRKINFMYNMESPDWKFKFTYFYNTRY